MERNSFAALLIMSKIVYPISCSDIWSLSISFSFTVICGCMILVVSLLFHLCSDFEEYRFTSRNASEDSLSVSTFGSRIFYHPKDRRTNQRCNEPAVIGQNLETGWYALRTIDHFCRILICMIVRGRDIF